MLGEGPVWDSSSKELVWVDIERCKLHIYHFPSGTKSDFQFDSLLSAVVPVDNSNLYLLAFQKGLALFNRGTGEFHYFDNPEKDIPTNRFNDGKCDPQGRFWIGSMDCGAAPGKGSLYRVDWNQKVTKMLSGVGVSNGLAWDESKSKMYYIDTLTYQVVSFDFDAASGSIGRQQSVIAVPKSHGAPDGMCIDEEAMLWIAHWGGANVSRWDPRNGKLLEKIPVPAPYVTSCCFGNDQLDTLYITSARTGLSDAEVTAYPHSGSVFSLKPGVKGKQSINFKINQQQDSNG